MEEVELIFSAEEIAALSREEHAAAIALSYSATPLRLATLLERGDLDTVYGFKLWAVQLATQARVGPLRSDDAELSCVSRLWAHWDGVKDTWAKWRLERSVRKLVFP